MTGSVDDNDQGDPHPPTIEDSSSVDDDVQADPHPPTIQDSSACTKGHEQEQDQDGKQEENSDGTDLEVLRRRKMTKRKHPGKGTSRKNNPSSNNTRSGASSRRNQSSTNTGGTNSTLEIHAGKEISNEEKAKGQINRTFFCAFVDIFRTEQFTAKFDINQFNMYEFNDWIVEIGGSSNAPAPVAELYAVCQRKIEAARARNEKKRKENAKSSKPELKGVGDVLRTQQVVQIARGSIAVQIFACRDERIYELFNICFRQSDLSTKYIVGTVYMPNVLGRKRRRDESSGVLGDLKTPSRLEALLFFHCIRLHKDQVPRFQSHSVGSRIGFVLQKMVDCWGRLIANVEVTTLGRFSSLILPYIIFDETTGLFRVLKSKEDGFATTMQETTVREVTVSKTRTGVDVAAWCRTDEIDTALRFIIDMFFTHLQTMIVRPYLYSANEKDLVRWTDLFKYNLPPNARALPPVFSELPEQVCDALGVQAPEQLDTSEDDGTANVMDIDNEETSATATSPQSKRQKTTATEGTTAESGTVVKNEPLSVTIRPGRSAELSPEGNDAYNVVNGEMWKTVRMYQDDFRELVQAEGDQKGRDITGRVDFLITDPPYNCRREDDKENSDHDVFTQDDMEELVDFCVTVMKDGAHGLIFCAFSQFEDYRQSLLERTTEVSDYENDKTGKTKKPVCVFKVETIPYVIVKRNGSFNNPGTQAGAHVNMVETCVHFWKRGGTKSEMQQRLDYQSPSPFGCVLPSWTNVVTNVPQPVGREVIYHPEKRDETGHRSRLRPEQKPISLFEFLINKFTSPEDLVCDPCGGTFPAAKACITLPQPRAFIGTDKDELCVEIQEDRVIETYAQQLLNPQSGVTTTDASVLQAAQLICQELERLRKKARADAWQTPKGLVPIQNFPPHIVEWLMKYYEDRSLFEKRGLSMNRWDTVWVQRMNAADPRALRVHEAEKLNLVLRPSTIRHADAGLGVFAGEAISAGTLIGFYYGAIIYGDLNARPKLHKTVGSGMLAVTVQDYNKWALKIDNTFYDADNTPSEAWVVGAPFCVCRYINDPMYRPGDKDEKLPEDRKRKANVSFLQSDKAVCNRDFELYSALEVRAIRDIGPGEEMFCTYGGGYTFPSDRTA